MIFSKKHTRHSDEELLRLIQQGKDSAFNELYDRYSKRMYGFFYRMLGADQAIANDMTQELFLKIVTKSNSFDPTKSFETWFFSIARNLCKNEYRRRERLQKNKENWSVNNVGQLNAGVLPTVEQTLDHQLFNDQLAYAIKTLDLPHKSCFVLRYQEELSIKEISAILEIPEGTVKSRLYYALKKLEQKLLIFRPASQKKAPNHGK